MFLAQKKYNISKKKIAIQKKVLPLPSVIIVIKKEKLCQTLHQELKPLSLIN